MSISVNLYGPFMFHVFAGLLAIGVDARLFLDARTLALRTGLRDEPLLQDSRVRIGDWVSYRNLGGKAITELDRQFAGADYAVVSDLGPIVAARTHERFAFMPAGGDLTVVSFPFLSRHQRQRGRADLKALALAHLQRRGIRKAREIWCMPMHPFLEAANRIHRGRRWTQYDMPQPMDLDLFTPGRALPPTQEIRILHPTRIMLNDSRFHKRTGQWKRNDVLLDGIRATLDRGVKVKLTIPSQLDSPDLQSFKRRAHHLEIAQSIRWISTEHVYGFSWRELVGIYQTHDVIADQFGVGWPGQISLEAACCGLPALGHFKQSELVKYYEWNPFHDLQSGDDIADFLVSYRFSEAARQERRLWAAAHHDRRLIGDRARRRLKSF